MQKINRRSMEYSRLRLSFTAKRIKLINYLLVIRDSQVLAKLGVVTIYIFFQDGGSFWLKYSIKIR